MKSLIHPDRVRTIPKSFSWIDRRLVSEGYLERLSGGAILLYFFLVTVSDGQGLSFYGDRRTTKLLKMPMDALDRVRGELMDQTLIAYHPPLYQVLALNSPKPLVMEVKGSRQTLVPMSEMLRHHK